MSFKVISFDCYGTLIDWERGIYNALLPLRQSIPPTPRSALLTCFTQHESSIQASHPSMLYADVLSTAYLRLAADFDVSPSPSEAGVFGRSVGEWPVFPDTLGALTRLRAAGYKLIVLSNVDLSSFAATVGKQLDGFEFDLVITAEEVGAYKPDLTGFKMLLERSGVGRQDMLHAAQSLRHDHEPAGRVGLTSAWIDRGEGMVMGRGRGGWTWRFESLDGLADFLIPGNSSTLIS